MVPSTSLSEKHQLRHAAREHRKALMLAAPDFAQVLARHAEALGIAPGMIVGGYHAMPEEADPAALLERLVALGAHAAFPRVAARGQPLEYHRVPDGEVRAPGTFGIREPLASWPPVTPHILLVPLLAFDARGHRLGYGGGFYDRTLEALKVPAIGIGFAGQEVSSLPAEAHDIALSAVLTEAGFRRFS
jgi:5-formyltetrahydrofolate cyclo-ligase